MRSDCVLSCTQLPEGAFVRLRPRRGPMVERNGVCAGQDGYTRHYCDIYDLVDHANGS